MAKLAAAGFSFKEGANHIKAFDVHGNFITTIPRHTEVNERTVRSIEKQTGVALR